MYTLDSRVYYRVELYSLASWTQPKARRKTLEQGRRSKTEGGRKRRGGKPFIALNFKSAYLSGGIGTGPVAIPRLPACTPSVSCISSSFFLPPPPRPLSLYLSLSICARNHVSVSGASKSGSLEATGHRGRGG